ncbi:MAG: hypothetical protein ABW104_07755, partial [Candidatus Thiodiazotropha sp. 6PLUC2]
MVLVSAGHGAAGPHPTGEFVSGVITIQFRPPGESLSSLNTATRSLDEVQRNPGEHRTNLPGFRFTPSRLPCF